MQVAVNLAEDELRDVDLEEMVCGAIDSAGLPAGILELEVTEGSLLHQSADSLGVLEALEERGVGFCLDDFGAGLSSLSSLSRWPVHRVKIIGSAIQDAVSGSNDTRMISAIVSAAHHMDMHVVAQGVETEEQFALLKEVGCDHYQGYHFLPPMPLDDILVQLDGAG